MICRVSLQDAAERAGIDQSLRNAGVKQSVSALFGAIIFLCLLSVFLSVALHLMRAVLVHAHRTRPITWATTILRPSGNWNCRQPLPGVPSG